MAAQSSKINAEAVLETLLTGPRKPLAELPKAGGLYGLHDHDGVLRYIGCTERGLHYRIWGNHAAGDGNSHKFSTIYNAGRLWHDRKDARSDPDDGAIAKAMRATFARKCCSATCVELPGWTKPELLELETSIRQMAPSEAMAWNDARRLQAFEPEAALDALLDRIKPPAFKLEALNRQRERWAHPA